MTYEEWMEGWGVSKTGSPYRQCEPWEDKINMGIRYNHKGYHFWINSRHCHWMMKWFIWSEGYETEEEAMRTLYGYLYEHKKARVIESEQWAYGDMNKRKANANGEGEDHAKELST